MAFDGQVVVGFGAKDAGLTAAWNRGKQSVEAFGKELEKLVGQARRAGGAVKETHEGLSGFAKQQVAQWATVATGVGIATGAVYKLMDISRQVREETATTTKNLDDVFRKLAIQGRMKDLESQGAKTAVFGVAERLGMPVENVSEIARQLISSGLTSKQTLEGGAAELFAASMVGSAAGKEGDPRQLVESTTQFIQAQSKAQDRALTPENLTRTLTATHSLFLSRNIQTTDLQELAKAAPALSAANMGLEEQIATFTRLRDVLNPEEAATALRNVVGRMQTAGSSKSKATALAKIGLKPEDVDMEGEDFTTALTRLKEGLSTVGQAKQATILTKLFEERGRLGAQVLLDDIPKLAQYTKEAMDPSAFLQAVETGTTGPAAGERRRTAKRQRQVFGGQGIRDDIIAGEIGTDEDHSAFTNTFNRWEYNALRFVGVPETVAQALVTPVGEGDKISKRTVAANEELRGAGPIERDTGPSKLDELIEAVKDKRVTIMDDERVNSQRRGAKSNRPILQSQRGAAAMFNN